MSDEQINNTGEQSIPNNLPPIGEWDEDVSDSTVNTINENSESQHANNQQQETINKSNWTKKDTVDTVIGGFTILVFIVGIWQALISRDSVKAAETANELTKQNIDSTKKRDSIRDAADRLTAIKFDSISRANDSIIRRKDSINMKLAEQSLAISQQNADAAKASFSAELEAYKTNQEQFIKTNQPYLEMEDVIISDIRPNTPIEVFYSINNLSNIPIKILGQTTFTYVMSENNPTIVQARKDAIINITNKTYLIKDYPSLGKITLEIEQLNERSILIEKRLSYIFLYRKYKYKNLVTGTNMIYEIYLKLAKMGVSNTFPTGTYAEILYNENYKEGDTPPN